MAKAIKNIVVGNIDARHMGQEPEWKSGVQYTELDVSRAQNWYNYILDDSQKLNILLSAFTEDKDRAAIKALDIKSLPCTAISLIRMRERGFVLNEARTQWLDSKLAEYLEMGRAKIAPKLDKVKPIPKINPDRYIADMEDVLDKFYNNDYKPPTDIPNWFRQINAAPKQLDRIVEYYQPLLTELNSKDEDVLEGYAHLSKQKMNRYRAFVDSIITTAKSLALEVPTQTSTKPRKTRKKKAISAEKMVNKVKYQAEDKPLGITSIDPVKLIGAKEVWLYNSKTRLLQHYVSVDSTGFQVKGTTLLNYDDKVSIMKKVRKPDIIKKDIVESGPKAAIKNFLALKVKELPCNGRINAFTLILRAIK